MLTAHSYGVEVVTVEVDKGEDETKFVVHKDLLAKHSEFFRAALCKEWKEGQEKKVPLEEQDPEIFQIFQHFIYSGCICSNKNGDSGPDSEVSWDVEWERLGNAWVFGEVILSTSFKDAVVDAIIAKTVTNGRHPTGLQNLIYPVSPSKAGIRTLILDLAVYAWTEDCLEDPDQPCGFLYDLAIAFLKMKTNGLEKEAPYESVNTCKYHEHGEEGTCYKDMF